MATTDEWLSIEDALKILEMNRVDMSRASLSMAIFRGTVKSEKMFSARVIHRTELAKLVADRISRRETRGK